MTMVSTSAFAATATAMWVCVALGGLRQRQSTPATQLLADQAVTSVPVRLSTARRSNPSGLTDVGRTYRNPGDTSLVVG